MKALSKKERELLFKKYDGRCAYCGCDLEARWHADHIEPILRNWYNPAKKGECERPELHVFSNFNPSCAPCNIDKHAMKLEDWRYKLSRTLDVLMRNNPTYRHAVRFGMLEEKPAPIVFYFEKYEQLQLQKWPWKR